MSESKTSTIDFGVLFPESPVEEVHDIVAVYIKEAMGTAIHEVALTTDDNGEPGRRVRITIETEPD
jgi:hypothetical protein